MTYLQWHAGHEERPTSQTPTFLREFLKIEQLSDGQPPSSQAPLVDVDVRVVEGGGYGPSLESRRVARDGRELIVPEPAQRVQCRLQPHEVGVRLDEEVWELVGGELVVSLDEPDANEQDVAGPELDVAFLHDGLEVLELHRCRLKGVRVDPIPSSPFPPVEQDTAADDAALVNPDLHMFDISYHRLPLHL